MSDDWVLFFGNLLMSGSLGCEWRCNYLDKKKLPYGLIFIKALGCFGVYLFSSTVQAACGWDPSDIFKQRRNFTYSGRSISVPVNAEGLVYSEVFTSYYKNISVVCNPPYASGVLVNTDVSILPAATEEFQFKNGDYYWKVELEGHAFFRSINGPGNAFKIWTDGVSFDRQYRLSIYKRGDANVGFTVPAGLLGTWVTSDGFEIAQFTLQSPIVFNAASCISPDVNVDMGKYLVSDIASSSGVVRLVNFDLSLLKCPASITRVDYLLKANTPVIDSNSGIVSLDKSSTADGVGLQIKDASGIPLALDVYHSFNASNNAAGNIKIPLSSSYIKIPNKNVQSGTANTQMTFVLRYL